MSSNGVADDDAQEPLNRPLCIFEEIWGRRSISSFGSRRGLNFVQDTVVEDDIPPDPFRFDFISQLLSLIYFKSSLYASVLEDTITELRILAECNNELRITKTMAEMTIHRANKYSIAQPTFTDELDGINTKDLGNEVYKLNKLASDRNYLYETLLETYLDLSLKRTFKTLHDHIAIVVDRETHFTQLVDDEAKNRVIKRDLARQLRVQRNHIKSVNYDADAHIDSLKTEVEDAALQAEICSRYVVNWQVARSEQHQQTIKWKEGGPLRNIDYYKTRTENEQRVHSEVELLMNIAINEKLEMVEQCMTKYDKDMEKMDLKIQIMKNDYTNAYEERLKLEDTLAIHDKLIKDWVYFKDEREKARLYREKMTNSAVTVQAWWRGLLVRMQLGPYKPVKKPAKAGGKKK